MTPELTLVIPVFNGADYLPKTLLTIGEWVSAHSEPVEVIFVNDGSIDTTEKVLDSVKNRFKVVNLPRNLGKGAALRAGFLASTGSLVAFTDADLPYGLPAVESMAQAFKTDPNLQFLYGSRSHAESRVRRGYGFVRNFGRWFFSHAAQVVVGPNIKDTQCGIKMFRRPLAVAAAHLAKLNRFAFDIEIFVIAEQNHFKSQPFPVELSHRPESSVHIVLDTARMLVDIALIFVARLGGAYRIKN